MALKARKGQSFIEYTVLITIISVALIAMTPYIIRAINARVDAPTNNTLSGN